MLLKPYDVIRTVSCDLLLMRYPGYFRNCSNVLEAACQGKLAHILSELHSQLFNCDSALLEFVILQGGLYDNQLLVFLKGHSEIDRVLVSYEQAQVIES